MRLVLRLILMTIFCQAQVSLADEPLKSLTYIDDTTSSIGKFFPGLYFQDESPAQTPHNSLNPYQVQSQNHREWFENPISTKYETYSIMFICRDLTENEINSVQRIHNAFSSFAGAIRKTNSAVWIGADKPATFNIAHGKDACDRFKLNYNEGPYVVYYRIRSSSSFRDDDMPHSGGVDFTLDTTKINFDGIHFDRIPNVLNRLEQAIRRRERVAGNLSYEQYKQRLLSFVADHPIDIDNVEKFLNIAETLLRISIGRGV